MWSSTLEQAVNYEGKRAQRWSHGELFSSNGMCGPFQTGEVIVLQWQHL